MNIHHKKLNIKIRYIILVLIIFFNSGVFLLYGIAKMAGWQFNNDGIDLSLTLKQLRPFTVMWYFFGLSRGYALFIAFVEIISAVLILPKRTRLFGALVYLMAVGNIVALNFFFRFSKPAMCLSFVLLVNTIIILFTESNKVKLLFK